MLFKCFIIIIVIYVYAYMYVYISDSIFKKCVKNFTFNYIDKRHVYSIIGVLPEFASHDFCGIIIYLVGFVIKQSGLLTIRYRQIHGV